MSPISLWDFLRIKIWTARLGKTVPHRKHEFVCRFTPQVIPDTICIVLLQMHSLKLNCLLFYVSQMFEYKNFQKSVEPIMQKLCIWHPHKPEVKVHVRNTQNDKMNNIQCWLLSVGQLLIAVIQHRHCVQVLNRNYPWCTRIGSAGFADQCVSHECWFIGAGLFLLVQRTGYIPDTDN